MRMRWLRRLGLALLVALVLPACVSGSKATHVRGHAVNREGPGEVPMPPWTPPGAPPVVRKWR